MPDLWRWWLLDRVCLPPPRFSDLLPYGLATARLQFWPQSSTSPRRRQVSSVGGNGLCRAEGVSTIWRPVEKFYLNTHLSTYDRVTDSSHSMSADDGISSAGQGHNRSAQQGVDLNPDPVLAFSNEHHHAHTHHGQTATHAEKDDLMFAKSTEDYLGNGDAAAPDYKVRAMTSRDEESGSGGIGEIRNEDETDGRGKWTFKRVYAKYKLAFHFAIWAVWTA